MVKCEPTALLKLLAHAAKYPSQSVNGILLGNPPSSGSTGTVHVVDAVPLCHNMLGLALPAEIALVQVEAYAAAQGLRVVGHYHCDVRQVTPGSGPPEPPAVAKKIADKIYDRQPSSVLLFMDSRRLKEFTLGAAAEPLEVYRRAPGTREWRRGSSETAVQVAETSSWKQVKEDFFAMYKQQRHRTLADWDEHLDDAAKDWANKAFVQSLKFALPGQAQ